MKYRLFLDDERYPIVDTTYDWQIARNYDDAVWMVTHLGLPYFISFDHDLGAPQNRTGMDFARWLVDHIIDKKEFWFFQRQFQYYVHSMNPIGARNIQLCLEDFRSNIENDWFS